jgi:toxin ParE1/3/4
LPTPARAIFSPLRGSVSLRAGMADYRLSERARADLIDIYDFTETTSGDYQADAYYAGL